jgi:molecular chaperone HtpG
MPHEYAGKNLKSLSQGEIDLNSVPLLDPTPTRDDDPESLAKVEDTTVIAAVKNVLGNRVSDVRASQRLTESPACLVAANAGQDRELQRLLARESQGFGPKPVLELNMRHPLVRALSNALADKRDDDVADVSSLLFDQGKILDGEVPEDPAGFATRLNRLIVRGLPM